MSILADGLGAHAALPSLVVVFEFEAEPSVIVNAEHEGDALRLRAWLERSRHWSSIEQILPRVFAATGAAA